MATLGQKHKKSASWAIKTYGKEPVAYATLEDGSKIKLASFPTKKEINETTKGFPKVMDFWTTKRLNTLLEAQRISRLNKVEAKFFSVCAVEGCECNLSQIYHIRRLNRVWKG